MENVAIHKDIDLVERIGFLDETRESNRLTITPQTMRLLRR